MLFRSIVFVVARGLAFRGLILFAEVAAAALVAVERVAADEFGEFEVIDDRARGPRIVPVDAVENLLRRGRDRVLRQELQRGIPLGGEPQGNRL